MKASSYIFNYSLFIDKGNGMNTKKASKGKTYSEIIKTEAEGNILDFHTDSENCLLFWTDLTDCCLTHADRDINQSYDRGLENSLIRETLEKKQRLYFQIEGTDRFILKSFKNKVIDLRGEAQTLKTLLKREIDSDSKRAEERGKKSDPMKHTVMKRVHVWKSLIQTVENDTIFLFDSRTNDTKTGGLLELLRFRLSALLSSLTGQKMKGLFVHYMEKPEVTEARKSFKNCKSLIASKRD